MLKFADGIVAIIFVPGRFDSYVARRGLGRLGILLQGSLNFAKLFGKSIVKNPALSASVLEDASRGLCM
jgi:hypothetical protein